MMDPTIVAKNDLVTQMPITIFLVEVGSSLIALFEDIVLLLHPPVDVPYSLADT